MPFGAVAAAYEPDQCLLTFRKIPNAFRRVESQNYDNKPKLPF